MRTTDQTARFKRDYKRELKGRHGAALNDDFLRLLALLTSDTPLPWRYRDHALSGEFRDHRDCHIKPDLVLIYRKPDATSLELVRLGSHSELSL